MMRDRRFRRLAPIIFLISGFVILLFLISSASARDIYVDINYRYPDSDGSVYKPYKSIQQAINEAEDGDNIYVFPGLYNETLVIDKTIKLQAIEKQNATIWKKDNNRYTIRITADMVAIEDFKIIADSNCFVSAIYVEGSRVTIQGNYIEVNGTAWQIYIKSDGNTIGDNVLEGGKGIMVSSSSDNVFVNNDVNNSTKGIELQNSRNAIIYGNSFYGNDYSIYAQNSGEINVTNNTFRNSKFVATKIIDGSHVRISNNIFEENPTAIEVESIGGVIRNNKIESNSIGILLKGSNMEICGNNITKSNLYGLHAGKGSAGNVIYKNYFKENYLNAKDEGSNSWDNGIIGNYWDDYNDVDRDGDGIGDYPYSKYGVIDRYPTGKFLKPPDKPELVSPRDGEDNVGLNPVLKVKVTDPDSKYLSVYFYDASNDELLGVRKGVESGETVSLSINLPYNTVMAWYVIVNDTKLEATSDIWTFSTLPVPPANNRPVADPGGPYHVEVNKPVNFDASKSYDPDGEIVFYRWNFGDGSGDILKKNPTHVYSEAGTYTVTLTVIDNSGTSDTKTTEVYVTEPGENVSPIANPGGPYYGKVNEIIVFNASKSYDPDGEIVEYVWSFGDGTTGYGINPEHKYSKPGTYEVKLTVKDNDGKTASSTTYANIVEKSKTPGFDIILIIASVAIAILIFRRR